MPVTDKFTSRVLLVTRENNQELPDFQGKEKSLVKLLIEISKDSFLKSQITQIDIRKNRNIYLYPQVGKQVIEFGRCVNIKDKLKRLKIFYKEIIPRKGWNAYKKINLRFDNQIICE